MSDNETCTFGNYDIEEIQVQEEQHHKSRAKFSEEEDKKIVATVMLQGPKAWRKIAEKLPGRTARQIRERWMNYLCPDVNHSPWTKEEEELILSKVAELGKQWSKIAKFFPGRTDVTIKNRYMKLMRNERRKERKLERELELKASACMIFQEPFMKFHEIHPITIHENEEAEQLNDEYSVSSPSSPSSSSGVEDWFPEETDIELNTVVDDWPGFEVEDIMII